MRLTAVTAGAAVVSVITAHSLKNGTGNLKHSHRLFQRASVLIITYLRQRAAAPFLCPVHEAAGRVLGAAGLGVTHVLGRPRWTGNSVTKLLLQGRDLLQPGQAETTGLLAGLFSHVTLVAFRTAVLAIVTAHSLETTRSKCSLMPPEVPVNVRFSVQQMSEI